MSKIIAHAVAKVNLMLNIYDKSEDGYHKMESIFVFLNDIFDILEFDTSLEFNDLSGRIDGVDDEKNSVKLATKILSENFKRKIPHVKITKNLPISGGVGGGSSDSACFVNSVFDIWGFSDIEKMKHIDIFEPLGADSIVFLHKYFTKSNILFLDGTGLQGSIKSIKIPELKNCYILLINDGIKMSTKDVFENLNCTLDKKFEIENCNFEMIKNFRNSLQSPAISIEPYLKKILSDIESTKPICCGVSGSGSTCFGLYKSFEDAKSATEKLKYKFVKKSEITCI